MGRAAAVLRPTGTARAAVGTAILVLLAAYDALAGRLPDVSLNAATALTALVLMPATLALVWLALPLRRRRGVFGVTVALAILGGVWYAAGFDVAANLAKLAAATLGGFWFLTVFERRSWIVLVACVVPIVDALSVWRGPTREIVGDRPEVFGALSVSFPSPGGGAFQLGLPDVIFFALFLAATVRWRLRPGWTWLAMTAALGVTIALAVATDPFGIGGLPALPALSLAFLLVNGDVLLGWRVDRAALVPAMVAARDVEPLAAFYRDALGTAAEAEDGVVRVWASWTREDADGLAELGFEVDDLGEAFRRALEAGAQPRGDVADEPWGPAARLRDPAGTPVCLRQTPD